MKITNFCLLSLVLSFVSPLLSMDTLPEDCIGIIATYLGERSFAETAFNIGALNFTNRLCRTSVNNNLGTIIPCVIPSMEYRYTELDLARKLGTMKGTKTERFKIWLTKAGMIVEIEKELSNLCGTKWQHLGKTRVESIAKGLLRCARPMEEQTRILNLAPEGIKSAFAQALSIYMQWTSPNPVISDTQYNECLKIIGSDYLERIEFLAKLPGVSINAHHSETNVSCAIIGGISSESETMAVLGKLLSLKANIFLRDFNTDQTPLMTAASFQYSASVKQLLEACPDSKRYEYVNLQDEEEGHTALMLIIDDEEEWNDSHSDTAQELLKNGACPHIRTRMGLRALDIANSCDYEERQDRRLIRLLEEVTEAPCTCKERFEHAHL